MAGITELTQDVLAGPGSGSQAATVVGLQTRPVGNALPALGDVLTWDGAKWAPAAAAGGGGLQTAFDIDFATETPVDIKAGGDGVYTFGGVAFDAINTAQSDQFEVSNALGLGIRPKVLPPGGTCPGMSVSLASAAPSVDLVTDEVYLVAHVTYGPFNKVDQQMSIALMYGAWGGTWFPPNPLMIMTYGISSTSPGVGPYRYGADYNFGTDRAGVYDANWSDQVGMLKSLNGGRATQWFSQPFTSFPSIATQQLLFYNETVSQPFYGTPPATLTPTTVNDAQIAIFSLCGTASTTVWQLRRLALYYK